MDNENTAEDQADMAEVTPAQPQTAGRRLRAARDQKGLTLEQLSAQTRIPERHLEAVEAGEYERLPSRTYAVGFTRTYARAVGLDEHALIAQVAEELDADDPRKHAAAPAKFEPGDPARLPSRGLAWFSAAAVILLLIGGYTFYSSYFAPGLGPAPLTDDSEKPAAAEAARPAQQAQTPTIDPGGEVVFTSEMDGTWAKFYDGEGERLYEAQMDKGDSFTVPADAQNPQIWTGRPYAFAITIDGKSVAKLSEEDTIVRDVPVSAKALLARSAAPPAPAATPSPAATVRSTAGG